MEEISECCQKTNETRRNLQWDDLSRKGRVISSMLFFLLYLGPSHAISTTTNYPWHVRMLLGLPFTIIGLSLLVPRLNRIPVNPHICGLISVYICFVAVSVVTPKGLVPEWATAIAIAGLAALMTGPMLSGFDKKERERKASGEFSPGDTSATAKAELTGLRSQYGGCLVGTSLPFVLAIPVWLLVFPESYDHALKFFVDSIAVAAFLAVAAITGWGAVRRRRTIRPLGYVTVFAALGLAGLGVWNLVAIYMKAGISAVTLFGWELRPSSSALVVFGGLVLAAIVSVWVGKGKPPASGT